MLEIMAVVSAILSGVAGVVGAFVAWQLLRVTAQLRDLTRDSEQRGRALLRWSQVQQLNEAGYKDPETFDRFLKADWDPEESLEDRRRRWAAFLWLAPSVALVQAEPGEEGPTRQLLRELLHDPLIIRVLRTRGYPTNVRRAMEQQILELYEAGEITAETALTAADDARAYQTEIIVRAAIERADGAGPQTSE